MGLFLQVLKLLHVILPPPWQNNQKKKRPADNLPIPHTTVLPELINHVARFICKLLYRNTEMYKMHN